MLTLKLSKTNQAVKTFDSPSRGNLSRKAHKYTTTFNRLKHTTLPFTSIYQLPLLLLSVSTLCAGQNVECMPRTAIASQSTPPHAVSTQTRGHQPHKLWQCISKWVIHFSLTRLQCANRPKGLIHL